MFNLQFGPSFYVLQIVRYLHTNAAFLIIFVSAGLLSLNVCLCLSADLSLKMKWTGVKKNISSQKHIEFRDDPASVFLCVIAGDGGVCADSSLPHIYTIGSHPFPLFAHSNKSSL